MRDGSCGFADGPPTVVDANSVVVVLPKISAPAARSVIIEAASTIPAGSSLYIGEL